MAKVVVRPNGERIIVGDDTPEDIQYDDDEFLSRELAQKFQEKERFSSPVCVTLTFVAGMAVTINLKRFKRLSDGKTSISGTMMTEDFVSLLRSHIRKITSMSISYSDKTEDIGGPFPHILATIKSKDMTEATVKVNLSIVQTT